MSSTQDISLLPEDAQVLWDLAQESGRKYLGILGPWQICDFWDGPPLQGRLCKYSEYHEGLHIYFDAFVVKDSGFIKLLCANGETIVNCPNPYELLTIQKIRHGVAFNTIVPGAFRTVCDHFLSKHWILL